MDNFVINEGIGLANLEGKENCREQSFKASVVDKSAQGSIAKEEGGFVRYYIPCSWATGEANDAEEHLTPIYSFLPCIRINDYGHFHILNNARKVDRVLTQKLGSRHLSNF